MPDNSRLRGIDRELMSLDMIFTPNYPILLRNPKLSQYKNSFYSDMDSTTISKITEESILPPELTNNDSHIDAIFRERTKEVVRIVSMLHADQVSRKGYLAASSLRSFLNLDCINDIYRKRDFNESMVNEFRYFLTSLPGYSLNSSEKLSETAYRQFSFATCPLVKAVNIFTSRLNSARSRIIELSKEDAELLLRRLYSESPYAEHLYKAGLTDFLLSCGIRPAHIAKYETKKGRANILSLELVI